MHTSLACGKLMALTEANLGLQERLLSTSQAAMAKPFAHGWCLVLNACLCLSKGCEVSNLSFILPKSDKLLWSQAHHLPTACMYIYIYLYIYNRYEWFCEHLWALSHYQSFPTWNTWNIVLRSVKMFWHMPPIAFVARWPLTKKCLSTVIATQP